MIEVHKNADGCDNKAASRQDIAIYVSKYQSKLKGAFLVST